MTGSASLCYACFHLLISIIQKESQRHSRVLCQAEQPAVKLAYNLKFCGLAPEALNTKDFIAALTAEIEPFETSAINEDVFSEHNTQKDVKQLYINFIDQIQAIEGDFLVEAEELGGLAKEAKETMDERAKDLD